MSSVILHKCDKEAEIATIKTDVSWIRDEQKEARNDIKKILLILTEGEGKFYAIRKTLEGNGDPSSGLKHRVNQLEKLEEKREGAIQQTFLFGKTAQVVIMAGVGVMTILNFIIGWYVIFRPH